MAYGEKKRQLAERPIGAVSVFGFGVASAIGIGAAVIVDLFQHREASALYVINRQFVDITTMLGADTIPLYGVMITLMVLGAGSILFFEPITYRGAFSQGFGLLAALVTLAPSDIGTPLEAPTDDPDGMMMEFSDSFSEEAALSDPEGLRGAGDRLTAPPTPALMPTSTASAVSSLVQARSRSAQTYQLRIQIEFPDGLKQDVQAMLSRGTLAGKVWNPETGTIYNLFRNSGARMGYDDDTLRIETVVAAASPDTELWILVEADGYKIAERSFRARTGPNRIWNVTMETSRIPLFIQRLRHAYRF
ncbi:MAG: hypothetical protein AAGG79_05110 [Pseudomonadota bacterium]